MTDLRLLFAIMVILVDNGDWYKIKPVDYVINRLYFTSLGFVEKWFYVYILISVDLTTNTLEDDAISKILFPT